jgi:hypothetical protein
MAYRGKDRSAEIISDVIAVRFQKTLSYFIKAIEKNYREYELYEDYIPYGLQQSFIQYTRYLLHYFEVAPNKLDIPYLKQYGNYFYPDEFNEYKNSERDIEILSSVFNSLKEFGEFINSLDRNPEKIFSREIPKYKPQFLITSDGDNGFRIKFGEQTSQEAIESINYIIV